MRCLSVEVTRAVPLRYKLGWDAKFSQTKEKITGRVLLRTTVTVPDTTADIDLATVARCARDVKKAEKNAERGIGYLEVWLFPHPTFPSPYPCPYTSPYRTPPHPLYSCSGRLILSVSFQRRRADVLSTRRVT